MANMQKYKITDCAWVIGENLRDRHYSKSDREGNKIIVNNLTPNNYFLSRHCDYGFDDSTARKAEVKERIRAALEQHKEVTGRAARSDAVTMFSWVVTVPKDVRPEDEVRFFKACQAFLRGRYGAGNELACVVHRDEPTARHHMHWLGLPMRGGKLAASEMVNRNDLRSFHGALGKYVDRELGYHVSIELDEKDVKGKALSKVPKEYVKAVEQAWDEEEAARRRQIQKAAKDAEKAISARRDAVNKSLDEREKQLDERAAVLDNLEDLYADQIAELDRLQGECNRLRMSITSQEIDLGRRVDDLVGEIDATMKLMERISGLPQQPRAFLEAVRSLSYDPVFAKATHASQKMHLASRQAQKAIESLNGTLQDRQRGLQEKGQEVSEVAQQLGRNPRGRNDWTR